LVLEARSNGQLHGVLLWQSAFRGFDRAGAPKATFLQASEGNVRQCRFGAGSPLQRSASWGFAVAERVSRLRPGLCRFGAGTLLNGPLHVQ